MAGPFASCVHNVVACSAFAVEWVLKLKVLIAMTCNGVLIPPQTKITLPPPKKEINKKQIKSKENKH